MEKNKKVVKRKRTAKKPAVKPEVKSIPEVVIPTPEVSLEAVVVPEVNKENTLPKSVIINAEEPGAIKRAILLTKQDKAFQITGSVGAQYQLKRELRRA